MAHEFGPHREGDTATWPLHPSLRAYLRNKAKDIALAQLIQCVALDEAEATFWHSWRRGLRRRMREEIRFLAPLATPRMAAQMITRVQAVAGLAEANEGFRFAESDLRRLGERLEEYVVWKTEELLPMIDVVATKGELERLGEKRRTRARK